jgi:hypothetical protein
MTKNKGGTAATSSIRARAWVDFERLIRTHRFRIFAAVLAAVGAGVGAMAPSDVSTGRRFLTAVILALAAPLLAYVIALLWSFSRAPFRQRRELIARLSSAEQMARPLMTMEPQVDIRTSTEFGLLHETRHLSVAFIRVYNAQERGREEATAKHVSPEIKVFAPGDRLVFHHKGWDVKAWRDFTTGQEEHAFWLVAKRRDAEGCFIVQEENARSVMDLPDGVYVAELTLRGYMRESPIRKRFVFSSRGIGKDLSLEEEQ